MTLPQGWVEATLDNLTHHDSPICYGVLKPGEPNPGGVRMVRVTDIRTNQLNEAELVTITDQLDREFHRSRITEGDVLISVQGTVGRIAVVPGSLTNANISRTIARIRPYGEVEPRWLWRALRAPDFQNASRDKTAGTTRDSLNIGTLRHLSIPVPPLAEQRRIVAKLDALTVRLARTRAELERVPLLVAKLRQTTLARAFAGDLSADWRAREGSSMQDWRTCPLSDIADVQGGIQVGKKRPAGVTLVEVPYLRVANVQRGWLRLNEIKTLAVTAEERDRLLLEDGDILMNEGGDRDKLGRGWVWREEVPGCIHQNHVFRVRLKDQDFPPEFVSHYANEFGQAYFIDQGTQTTNLASISKRRVMALPVPVPPAAEAREIVRLITAAFARADRLEAEAARARALLDRLEAAILAKAFRGELVPQDPNDEPASVLLDRIRAERAAAPKPKRGRARKAVG